MPYHFLISMLSALFIYKSEREWSIEVSGWLLNKIQVLHCVSRGIAEGICMSLPGMDYRGGLQLIVPCLKGGLFSQYFY